MNVISTPVIEGIERTASSIRFVVTKSLVPASGGGGAVDSVNEQTGAVVLDAADVGADATGTAAAAVVTHEADANPHPGYLTQTEGDAAYDALGAAADAQSAAEATASGALSTHAADSTAVHGIADTAALVLTSDSRLSDARTPTAHAASHGSAGADAVTLAQSQVTGLTTDLAAKVDVSTLAETVRDTVGTALTSGSGVASTVDDAGDTITLSRGAVTINAQTGTSYILVLADAPKFVTMTNAAASTLTVPPNSSVAFPVGTVIEGAQLGAGQVTLTAGSGVTVNAAPGLKVAAQYGTFALLKVATDTWLAFGRLSA